MDVYAQRKLALLYAPTDALVTLLLSDSARSRGYELVVAGAGGTAPKATGLRLRCPWRVFALDKAADVEAHIKDVALVVNCSADDPTVLVHICVRLGIAYVDSEVVDCERVFDATVSAGQLPTSPIVTGVGTAAAVLDCMAHLLRSRLTPQDLQHRNLKLFLAQSELAPEQASKRVRRSFMPFIIRNGNKLVAGLRVAFIAVLRLLTTFAATTTTTTTEVCVRCLFVSPLSSVRLDTNTCCVLVCSLVAYDGMRHCTMITCASRFCVTLTAALRF